MPLRRVLAALCLLPVIALAPRADAAAPPPSAPALTAAATSIDRAAPIAGPVDWSELQHAIASRAWYVAASEAAAARPAPAPRAARRSSAPARSGGSHRGYPTARACVEGVENGGDYGRSSNPGHFGKFQFSRPTWIAFGGSPETWGHASPAEQEEVFDRAWNSPGGPGNWLPYDGCG